MMAVMEGWAFAKGHGTGNDFVILPDPEGTLPLTATFVASLCDRRRGIGADGVLRVVRTAAHPDVTTLAAGAEWFMDYWNSDGSLAEICGNGLRVFGRYLVSAGLAPDDQPLRVATRAGVVRVDVRADTVSVEMTMPRVYATGRADLAGHGFDGHAVDVGNPHLVCAVDEAGLTGLNLTAPPVTDPELFPNGVNVEFAAAGPAPTGADAYRRMRVYERGSGETLSCGTGACAVAAVALREGGRETGAVAVDVPGGRLTITITDSDCRLSGPATIVASGLLDPSAVVGGALDPVSV
jgi:diaminopimelate epimerase